MPLAFMSEQPLPAPVVSLRMWGKQVAIGEAVLVHRLSVCVLRIIVCVCMCNQKLQIPTLEFFVRESAG